MRYAAYISMGILVGVLITIAGSVVLESILSLTLTVVAGLGVLGKEEGYSKATYHFVFAYMMSVLFGLICMTIIINNDILSPRKKYINTAIEQMISSLDEDNKNHDWARILDSIVKASDTSNPIPAFSRSNNVESEVQYVQTLLDSGRINYEEAYSRLKDIVESEVKNSES